MERNVLYTYLSEKGEMKPIYTIENHNVSVGSLVSNRNIEYEVRFRLGWKEKVIRTPFSFATDNFRTLIFLNPENDRQTIGIPIMNIISCSLIK